MKKKVFSLFLSVLMLMSVVSALPASATAAEKGNIYNGQFHGTLELTMSPTLRVGEKISGGVEMNGYPLRFTGDGSFFGCWRDKTTNSRWFSSGELLTEEDHEYEYTATLMYSNFGSVRFDEIDGVTVNGVSVDYTIAEDDNILNIYVPYDAYIEVHNCVEIVHGNQWFIPGESAIFRSKLGPADANNHLAWGYSVGDEPYEFDVKTAYVYDHPFFVITVQNDYPDDIVSVSKFTCKPETDKAVAATCTKAGLTEGSHCKYCKKVLTAQKATPATGHQYIPSEESYPNPEATLSKDGCLVSPKVCKNCDDEYEKTAVIPKIGTVKLSKTAYTYNGKVQRPGVVVKDRTGKALKGGVDYNVSYPKGMKNVGKLKAKKKYYVRVRTYKTVKFGGKSVKLYSGWSKAKSVTTKK